MATAKKAGEKQTDDRAKTGKAPSAKAAVPAKTVAARKTTAAAPKAAAKSASKAPAKSAATKKKPLISPATSRIAKEVAAKAVKAVTKKVGEAVSSLSGKAKSAATAKPKAAAKTTAKTATAKAVKARTAPAEVKPAARTASSRKSLSASAPAASSKSARTKSEVSRPAAGSGFKSTASKKSVSKTAVGALAVDKKAAQAALKEFAGSESFRREEDIAETNPVDVREHFFHEHRGGPPPAPEARDLPNEYGDTKIILLVRDPEWVYAYWEINDDTREEMNLARNGHSHRMVIRLYKTTDRAWPDEGAHYFFDIDVSPYALNWYIKLPEAGQQWCGELGVFDEHNNYTPICRSNLIGTPRNSISDETDSEWMVVEETFRKLSRLGGVGGRQVPGLTTSRASETLLRQLQRQVTGMFRAESGGMSSGALYSGSLVEDRGGLAVARDFWLQVHTELILYGATEPDARVTVQDREVKLSPDGTFSIRFALPDGEQVLRVHATNNDGDMERTITPVVTKRTRDK